MCLHLQAETIILTTKLNAGEWSDELQITDYKQEVDGNIIIINSSSLSEEMELLSTDPHSLMKLESLSWSDEIKIAISKVAISKAQACGRADNDQSPAEKSKTSI